MTRNAFKEKIRTAFNLSREQQAAVMALVDAHAEIWGRKNGKSADAWFAERIEGVEFVDRLGEDFDLDTYYKEYGQEGYYRMGEAEMLENGKQIIRGFEQADVATAVHELAHVFRYELDKAELQAFTEWVGYDPNEFYVADHLWRNRQLDGDALAKYIEAEEKFARGFEQYLMDELALDVATPAIVNIFKRFANWLREVYNSMTGNNAPDLNISPEMKRVYDRLFFEEDVINAKQTLTQKLTQMPTGDKTIAIGVDTHQNYNVRYRLVEAADLVASHETTFKPNNMYPQELQARFRERAANQGQIQAIIAKFNPDEILVDTKMTDAGTPIIGPDMVVESGNGRIIALKTMAKNHPDKWNAYVQALTSYLEDYGFKQESLEGMEFPILVRERLDDIDRIAFALDANAPRTSEYSSVEQAYVDATKWSDKMLANFFTGENLEIYDAIQSPSNISIITKFVESLTENELMGMFDENKNLSRQGLERIKNSLLAKVFNTEPGQRILQLFGESADPLIRNIERSIEISLGDLASLESMLAEGRRPSDYSIANDIATAINAYLAMKESGQTLEDWNNATSLFNEDRYIDIGLYAPDATETEMNFKQELFHYLVVNRRTVKPLSEMIKQYVQSIKAQPEMDQMSMFGDVSRPPKEKLAMDIMHNLVQQKVSKSFLDYVRPGDEAKGPTLFQSRVVGDVPLYGTPTPRYDGRITEEAYLEKLNPLLGEMRDVALDDMESGTAFSLGDLPDDLSKDVQTWMTRLPEQMAGTKLASMRYGELMRDRALLNYQERYGIDDYAEMVFPYEFWFTRTIGEWAKRVVEKPTWFSMYARIREHQERMEQEGIPTRLKGKFRIPAPYLPDWMGNSIYIDPLKQIFPFSQFSAPMDLALQQGQNVEYAATSKIQEAVKEGRLTATQAKAAIENKDNPIWKQALAEAQVELKNNGDIDAMSLTSMMMTPAMWWTYPYHILKGTADQLYPLPGTRLGHALKSFGGPLGAIGSILSLPEDTIRKKFNLNTYGEWGDYYVDRTLSNMAGEGMITTEQALTAMIEKKGEIYETALQRVEQEMALKLPGSQTAMAIKEGKLGAVLYTLPTTLFPAGLLPEGELIQRGLKYEYNEAWDKYENGDPRAINEFFETHPEYQTRLALFKEPEERLHQFLVSEIWDKYTALDSKNKPLVIDQLGEDFELMFLDKETRDYTAIDPETLAHWAQLLGGYVPDVEATGGLKDTPLYKQDKLKLYRPEVIAQVNEYQTQRDEQFPNYKFLQDIYWSLPEYPKNVRSDYLEQYPELKEYWEWKDQYYDANPNVKAYMEEQQERYNNNEQIYTSSAGQEQEPETAEAMTARVVSQNIIPALQMQILFAHYAGKKLEGGAKTMLYQYWTSLGQPAGTFDAWVDMVIKELMK
jgi:hypothetical protein